MGSAIDTLMREHRVIERVLDALDIFASRIGPDGDHRAELGEFLSFMVG